MKYQAIKHLKTKTKLLGLFDSLKETENEIKKTGARFENLSYYGGFPTYKNQNQMYSIQGLADIGVVCSIPQKEIESYTF